MDLELKQINQYYGTENYYNVMGVNATDGIAYIMENGYSWVVTDAVVICKMKLKNEPFISIKLKLKEDNKAEIVYTDGNDKILYTQKYDYTNVKKELNIFVTDNVIMLSGEY